MSDLQLGLLAIGIVVVAAVFGYNKWQETRVRRRSDEAFGSRHADALLHRTAPRTDAEPTLASRTADAVDRTLEHTLGETTPTPAAPGSEPVQAAPAAPGLDPAVDYIVPLDCARPVAGAEAATKGRPLVDGEFIQPVQLEGYQETRASWGPLNPGERYRRLRVGLQLANRAGPVSADDLLGFCGAVREVAAALAAEPEFPDPDEAVARAGELDRFCAEVDVQIGLSVIGSESHTFPGPKVEALAETAGLAIGRDGRFHCYAEDGTELFSLANLEPMPFHPATLRTLQTRGVTVLFDVPRVPESASAFRRFIEFAHHLEQSLGGVLVDDNRKPIGQAALDAIAHQLERIHETMAARGIPAGSPLARRLFN